MSGLLRAWLCRFPSKVILGECAARRGPLMIRWFLVGSEGRAALLVHCFLRSDIRRHLHDHPWPFVTFLLSRGYWEHTPEGRVWRRRFSILYRPATWRHAVEVDRPTWTVVLRWRKVREWGFWTPAGWVHWTRLDYYDGPCDD